jgi:hypothetical protein
VIGRGCVVCTSSRGSEYYRANRDKALQRDAERYRENRQEILERQRLRRAENPEAVREKARKFWENHGAKQLERNRSGYQRNREKVLEKQRQHAAANPHVHAAKAALRRSRKRQAVPPWFGDLDDLVWLEAAHLVRLRRAATGMNWAADHMVPLAARSACGLHVASNCQVIPASMNASKLNKLVLINPGEWIAYLHQNF